MPYTEAKEHVPGRLNTIFNEPYQAFDNDVPERQLHLKIALRALLEQPMQQQRLILRVIHGWENGNDDPVDLRHSDHDVTALDDVHEVFRRYHQAIERIEPFPEDDDSLIAQPRDDAIAHARRQGAALDDDIAQRPAQWPTFERGLYLYTLFKMYHRLTYGEDESYRSTRCSTAEGEFEIHEFHLEEGEFAVVTPAESGQDQPTLLILHEGELEPVLQLWETAWHNA
ncbi:hypothetical protein [Aidingimonas halophila]|uniref:Uncharacterized protein n=1 Tax=Aidingimonas halophila TaxID=574349 RepID=A0A1H2SUF1_9GAMM|nr:hypothetical protein [Aidingimonas halophila]GHC17144.1 hypothetical protein GCM10008094_03190 [Aidingimonas halophila]SDW35085.1 hypothetical protein SAMN05443545_101655 [Aidingimonas halophila]